MQWVPNTLTASRIVLLVPLMWLLTSASDPYSHQLAFGLFVLASLTDGLDGWAARRLNCVSNLGIFFDPLADKVFANVLLVFLACHYPTWIPLWLILLILAREFAVQGFRSMAPCVGIVIKTDLLSKWKLIFQLGAAGAVLLGLGWNSYVDVLKPIASMSLVLALVTGYVSMIQIFRNNLDLWSRPSKKMEIR